MPKRTDFDTDQLRQLLAGQHQVVAREQALGCGIPPSTIGRWLQPGGRWQKMLPGVYLTVTGKPTPDQRDMSALLYAGPRSVLTGPSAVRRHRLRCPGTDTIDVLIPWTFRRSSTGFVRIHRTRTMPRCYSTGSIRFATPGRAVADAALAFTSLDEVRAVVAEAVQKRVCPIAEIGYFLEEGPRRGSAFLRTALAEVRAGVRSAAEAHFRKLVVGSGLPEPMFNALLFATDGTIIAEVDAWWARPGVAVEIDSQEYHFRRADWHATEARHNRMLSYGILPHHFAPSKLISDWNTIEANIRSSISQGLKRPPLPIVAMPAAG